MARMRITPEPAQHAPARARVVEIERIENPQAVYDRLKQLSVLPINQLFDRYEIQAKLNEMASNGHQSRVLYLHAFREQEKFERRMRPELAGVREMALRRLTAKQRLEQTSRRKIMTERDVEDYIYLDVDLRVRYDKALEQISEGQHAVDVLKSLADAWREKVYIVQMMAGALPRVHKDE
jgi:hypothetical protein